MFAVLPGTGRRTAELKSMRKFALFLLSSIAIAVAVTIGKNVADRLLPPPRGGQPVSEILAVAIEKENAKLPRMIDEHTRLDRVTQPSPNVLQNNYTLLNIDSPLPGEFANIENEVRTMIVKRACSTQSSMRLLERGITNVYSYNAVDGKHFGSVTVTKADCQR